MFRTLATILAGNVSGAVLKMLRTFLMAALLSLEDFGIGATFLIALAVVEMVSVLGLKQQIVQSARGNDPAFQAALQGFQVLRGAINTAILVALAWPVAAFFGRPDLVWAYQVAAFVQLVHAFDHFDVQRHTRRMNYRPMLAMSLVPGLGGLAVVWPLYLAFGDYRVMLFTIVIQSALQTATSHLVAERPYRLRFDRAVIAESIGFGWPLMLNGLMIFAILQGDRIIVGRELGFEVLAVFSMALGIAMAPTGLLAGTGTRFFLPQLSAAKAEAATFARLARVAFEAYMCLGALLVLGVALLGPPLIHLALGEKYAAALPLLALLAVQQSFRVFKVASAVVSLARGQTGNALIANIPRVLALGPAWYVAAHGGDLATLIWIGVAAEIAGTAIAYGYALKRLRLPRRPLLAPMAATAALLAIAAVHALRTGPGEWVPDPWTGGALVLAAAVLVAVVPALRGYVARRQMRRYDE
jgi:O-antigen/teichoic acid export membrane protein